MAKPRKDDGKGGRSRFGPGRLQNDVDDVFHSFGAEILYEDVEAAVSVTRFNCLDQACLWNRCMCILYTCLSRPLQGASQGGT